MTTITAILPLEVLDSRGNPTVEVHLQLDNAIRWRAIVPSWASTWIHEALELRDGDPSRFWGKWVRKAVDAVSSIIAPALVNRSFDRLHELDNELLALDGTANKSKLWANALLWVSMARCIASAKAAWVPLFRFLWWWEHLPTPMVNVMNGWAHALSWIDVQECMLVPIWASSFSEWIRRCAEIFQTLKKLLKAQWHATTVWDEWWFAPSLWSVDEALSLLCEAISTAGYTTDQIKLALDVAASEFYTDGVYEFSREGVTRSGEEVIAYYAELIEKYPIISIEDGFAEEDYATWIAWTAALWKKVMIVGDDLFVTNPTRLQTGIDEKQANAILIKLNQIWTVSETLQTIKLAQANNFKTIVSHRSWETEDTFIADLAVAMNTWRIKTWSTARTDRTAKYNQLLRIEHYLNWNLPIW